MELLGSAAQKVWDNRYKLFAAGGALWAGHYLYNVVSTPEIYFNTKNSFFKSVVSQTDLLHANYWPTIWAFNQHLSTAVTQIRLSPRLSFTREIVQLPDGGSMALDWRDLPSFQPDTTIVLFIPGLSGSSSSEYIQHMIEATEEHGFRCVVMNFRGTAGVPLESGTIYSAGWTSDLRFIANLIHEKYPNALKIGIGFSLGSNVLVKYTCEEGEKTPLSMIISISNPYDLTASIEFLESGTKLYTKILTYGVVQTFKKNKERLKELGCKINDHLIENSQTLSAYDENFTSKMFGFKSAYHYYLHSGCRQYIRGGVIKREHEEHKGEIVPGLKVPTIFISARDDPIIPETVIPIEECLESENTLLILTSHGGHVSFCEGLLPIGKSWMDRLVAQMLPIVELNLKKTQRKSF